MTAVSSDQLKPYSPFGTSFAKVNDRSSNFVRSTWLLFALSQTSVYDSLMVRQFTAYVLSFGMLRSKIKYNDKRLSICDTKI